MLTLKTVEQGTPDSGVYYSSYFLQGKRKKSLMPNLGNWHILQGKCKTKGCRRKIKGMRLVLKKPLLE